MSDPLSRRRFVAGLWASAATLALGAPVEAAAPQSSLRPRPRSAELGAERLIARARLGGSVSYTVANAANGTVLEHHNGARAAPPASVTKSVTALYALSALGPAHRFETRLLATGGVRNGVILGDLILAGGGDPTLDSNHLAALAADLKAAGIRELRGGFVVYDGALPRIDRIDPGQPDHVGYNPSISGIALNFNRLHFEWRRGGSAGYQLTMDARTDRYRPDVAMARMRLSDRAAPVYTFQATPKRDEWTVARSALGSGGARWLPVRLPALYAGDVFRTMARANGLVLPAARVSSRLPQGTDVLARHLSPPLSALLRDMLKFSNNLIAEMVGLAATDARRGKVGSLRASAAEMNRWAASALGMRDLRLVDHSGLRDTARMSANDMVTALVSSRKAGFRNLLKPIPMRDSQRRVISQHPVKVHAKTGTLNFVSSLAGYMTGPDGTELAFAIFSADEVTRAGIVREDRERPQGARAWNRRAKVLQQDLIERWSALYCT